MSNPRDYDLPHDTWRPNQEEAIEWAYELPKETVGILQAPTGFGKSVLPRALSQNMKTVALVRSKLLQVENYERGYDFNVLFGRNNYDCINPDAGSNATAGDCLFLENGMPRCAYYSSCAYAQARNKAKDSARASLNYAYWLHVHHERWPAPQALVLDEAHQLSDITLDWAGCIVTEEMRLLHGLPVFPFLTSGRGSTSGKIEEVAAKWLSLCVNTLDQAIRSLGNQPNSPRKSKQLRRVELLAKKLSASMEALQNSHYDWYIRSGPRARVGEADPRGFVVRPLTAKHHFRQYFLDEKWQTFLMSATIGDPAVLAKELGITKYDVQSAPSAWPASVRPVHILNVPRMGRSSKDADWEKQAEEIAKAIKNCPRGWNGLVHVVAIAEADRLARRLAKLGLGDRVWTPPRAPTDEQVGQWQNRMKNHPGSIAVSWSFWEGYDGTEERINICAKVPYPYLGDPYEIERRNYDGTLYNQRAAWGMEQALGRVRRGRSQDYDLDGKQEKYVAIADGSWNWIKKYFSSTLTESLVKA